jgi:hypothetical protein
VARGDRFVDIALTMLDQCDGGQTVSELHKPGGDNPPPATPITPKDQQHSDAFENDDTPTEPTGKGEHSSAFEDDDTATEAAGNAAHSSAFEDDDTTTKAPADPPGRPHTVYGDEAPPYPACDGALGQHWEKAEVRVGDRLDRIGPDTGYFLAPAGTPDEQRALNPQHPATERHTYEVVKPLPPHAFEQSVVANYYEEGDGGGMQYRSAAPVSFWVEHGYLEEIPPNEGQEAPAPSTSGPTDQRTAVAAGVSDDRTRT